MLLSFRVSPLLVSSTNLFITRCTPTGGYLTLSLPIFLLVSENNSFLIRLSGTTRSSLINLHIIPRLTSMTDFSIGENGTLNIMKVVMNLKRSKKLSNGDEKVRKNDL